MNIGLQPIFPGSEIANARNPARRIATIRMPPACLLIIVPDDY
jgi:hypothetical protein